jgi:hypothetical protein
MGKLSVHKKVCSENLRRVGSLGDFEVDKRIIEKVFYM